MKVFGNPRRAWCNAVVTPTPPSRRKPRLVALSVILVVYIGLFWIVGVADKLILHPTRNNIDVPEGRRETIPFGGGQLELWTGRTRISASRGGEPLAFVVDYSPNAGRAEYALMYGLGTWEGLAVEYVAVNYPGYGGSSGRATLAGVHASALAAYDAVAARAGGRPIFVTGMSLGTTAALHVAANRPVAGVLLQNPVPLRELILGKFGWWNLWVVALPVSRGVPVELDAIANAARVTAPGVFVLADRDELVPPRFQMRVVDAFAGEKRLVSLFGGHNDMIEGSARTDLRRGIEWLWATKVGTTGDAALPRGIDPAATQVSDAMKQILTPASTRPAPAGPRP